MLFCLASGVLYEAGCFSAMRVVLGMRRMLLSLVSGVLYEAGSSSAL